MLSIQTHARLAREVKTSIKRRAYNYNDGTNAKTGALETGLMFICFQNQLNNLLIFKTI